MRQSPARLVPGSGRPERSPPMNQAALKLSVAVLVATTLSSCRRGRDPAAMSLKLVAPAAGATVPATVLVAADVLGGIEPITVTFSAPGSAPVQKGVPPFTELLPLAGETGDLVTLTATAEDVRGARATDSVQVWPKSVTGTW